MITKIIRVIKLIRYGLMLDVRLSELRMHRIDRISRFIVGKLCVGYRPQGGE